MQFLAHWTQQSDQPALHRKVNVFILKPWLETACCCFSTDLLQTTAKLIRLIGGNHTAVGQHAGMGDRSVEVLLKQGDVKADRGIESLDRRMQTLFETITPGGGASARHSTRHRRSSTQIPSACQAEVLGTDGSITSSRTLSTTIDASSSN